MLQRNRFSSRNRTNLRLKASRQTSFHSDPILLAMHNTIPTRIIHIYSAPPGESEKLPLLNQVALANASLLHPDFDHVFFGAREMEEFIEKEFPEFQDAMASFQRPIQRFDLFRY